MCGWPEKRCSAHAFPACTGSRRPSRGTVGHKLTGYLLAAWLEIFGPVFLEFSAQADPRDPPSSPGLAPHINLHEKSAPQTNSKANWRRTTNPARLPSGTQD